MSVSMGMRGWIGVGLLLLCTGSLLLLQHAHKPRPAEPAVAAGVAAGEAADPDRNQEGPVSDPHTAADLSEVGDGHDELQTSQSPVPILQRAHRNRLTARSAVYKTLPQIAREKGLDAALRQVREWLASDATDSTTVARQAYAVRILPTLARNHPEQRHLVVAEVRELLAREERRHVLVQAAATLVGLKSTEGTAGVNNAGTDAVFMFFPRLPERIGAPSPGTFAGALVPESMSAEEARDALHALLQRFPTRTRNMSNVPTAAVMSLGLLGTDEDYERVRTIAGAAHDTMVRQAAVDAMVRLRGRQACADVIALAGAPGANRIQRAALGAVYRIDDLEPSPQLNAVLTDALLSEDSRAFSEAAALTVRQYDRYGDTASQQLLLDCLTRPNDDVPHVYADLARALADCGAVEFRPLIEALVPRSNGQTTGELQAAADAMARPAEHAEFVAERQRLEAEIDATIRDIWHRYAQDEPYTEQRQRLEALQRELRTLSDG